MISQQIVARSVTQVKEEMHHRPAHLDVVGVSDQLVDVGRLSAQLSRIVLQDDALAGAAVQAVGRLPFCCASTAKAQKFRL